MRTKAGSSALGYEGLKWAMASHIKTMRYTKLH